MSHVGDYCQVQQVRIPDNDARCLQQMFYSHLRLSRDAGHRPVQAPSMQQIREYIQLRADQLMEHRDGAAESPAAVYAIDRQRAEFLNLRDSLAVFEPHLTAAFWYWFGCETAPEGIFVLGDRTNETIALLHALDVRRLSESMIEMLYDQLFDSDVTYCLPPALDKAFDVVGEQRRVIAEERGEKAES